MAFFHFVNCLALSYAPYVLTYKYSGLNEYSSIWRCFQAALGYFLTQLAKLLVLATFFPTTDSSESFEVLPELLKSSADFIDVIGMHLVMTHLLNGKGEVRFISGGLGWGAAHSIASRLIVLWVGARASAFSWKWLQTSVDSSSDLILFLSMAALTWMATRSNSKAIIFVFLTSAVLHSFVYQMFYSLLHISGWSLVLAKFGYTAYIASGTLYAYANWGNVKRD